MSDRTDGNGASTDLLDPSDRTLLRVVTYNVRSLRDDADAVVRMVRATAPDVLCLQEVPRFLRWRSRLAGLARRTGLLYAGGGRGSGAVAVLVSPRVDVRSVDEILFSKRRGLHQRGTAVARLGFLGHRVLVASVHLGLDEGERLEHVTELLRHLGSVPAGEAPCAVVAGDLNDAPGSPTFDRLLKRFRDARVAAPVGAEPTFPARAPGRRIDAVLVDDGVEVVGCGVPDLTPADLNAATDHLPVVALLRLPG